MIVLPLTNEPNQTFKTTIPQGSNNTTLTFFMNWNVIAEYWQLSISNAETGEMYVFENPVVGGYYPAENYLRQFEYFGLGRAYIVPLSDDTPDYPQLNDWGTNFLMLWSGDV